jgi:hypothetical protein
MSKPKPYSKIRPGIEHGRSIRLAVSTKADAIRRNEELRAAGVDAHHDVLPDGQLSPLIYGSRGGRKGALRAMGFDPEEANA